MDEGFRQNLDLNTDDTQASLPLVSVIMPLYNMEDYVDEAIASVLNSNYSPLELIVVDDGSTDNSLSIVRQWAERDKRVQWLRQDNAGPCRARNIAVKAANGKYLLPVDADNKLAPSFIREAVAVLEAHPNVKVVAPTIERFGLRNDLWRLPPFSLRLLARRNMIDTCALYRHSDFDRVGGYCEEIIAREDWDFWIALLKDGGDVVRLPKVGYYYRVRSQSKRIQDRRLKRHVIRTLNRRHAIFFERELRGPLRRMRTWSRTINTIIRLFRHKKVYVATPFEYLRAFIEHLPLTFESMGTEIFKNRNAIRYIEIEGEQWVVKQFCRPHLFNRLVYRWWRKTKAQRSFEHAEALRAIGVGSPEPVGYCDTGNLLCIGYCYYVARHSTLPFDFRDLIDNESPQAEKALQAIARTTALMHEGGFWHKDYSGGNILWGETREGISVELIDLNRMRKGKVSLMAGCANFDRLEATPRQQRIMAEAYAQARNFDPDTCFSAIVAARNKRLKRSEDTHTT